MPLRHGGNGDTAPQFLTSVLDGCEWSLSRPYRFISGDRDPEGRFMVMLFVCLYPSVSSSSTFETVKYFYEISYEINVIR
jgi:hypothetical protein